MKLLTFALMLVVPLQAARAEERRVAFWPDAVPEALQAQVDGRAALELVRELGRFHRVQGSPGFAAAAEHLRAKLIAAGLGTAVVEHFPADGQTRYAHFRSYLGWDPRQARLEELSPRPAVLARFPELPVALADYSQDADVTAELVDVGPGTAASHYDGKEVAGKIVIASGPLPAVHAAACEERRAAGFLSDFPNQTTAWSGDDRDLVRWGHLSPYQDQNRFAFMVSRRQSDELRARLAAGERIMLRARVQARMLAASYDVLSATIPGTDPAAPEVILTAHLCHQSAGANDNASGSAVIFEVARALRAALEAGALLPPRRSIRFLWTPEIAGSEAWLVRHPELAGRLVAGIHMDMVGGLLATTRGTFHISRTAASRPHVVNVIAQAFFDDVVRRSARYAEGGGDQRRGLVWPPGSREVFLGDVRELQLGSDHEVFEEVSFGVPMVYFHDWPDVTIHTNQDQPENLDATKLGRVAYLGAGIAWTLAALPDHEAARLAVLAEAEVAASAANAAARAALAADGWDGALFVREAAATGAQCLESLAALWPGVRPELEPRIAALGRSALRGAGVPKPPLARDPRVPIRSPQVRGPLDVYYYNHLQQVLGGGAAPETALAARENGAVLAYEALNLVDGRRSVTEIRDVLSGRYAPVPVEELTDYFELLTRAAVVRLAAPGHGAGPAGNPR